MSLRRIAPTLAWSLLLFTSAIGRAELPFSLPVPAAAADGYDDEIPTPDEIVGSRIGQSITEPHQLVEYFRAVAEKSDRVTVQEYGRSYQKRPLIYAVVTSPENHQRLEEIVEANQQLSDSPDEVDDEKLSSMPAIVFQGFSVHGDEASTSEAAVLLLYHLAAGQGDEIDEMLDKLVLVIDPCLNPDGRQRFAVWANQNRGTTAVADPEDREHRQPWPGGRTNHYWFDLNRDWLPIRHPESQGRLTVINRWRPQIVTDYHEMGSDSHYFFQPGVPERVNRNIPPANQEITSRLAEHHAAALDEIGSLYFTRETFDDFNPGKGSTYPDVTGGIGILFEQAASRALLRETENGLLRYDFTIRNQLSTSLSTMKGALELREDLLRYQRDFYRDAASLARADRVKAYLISLTKDRTRAQELIRLLLAHRIRVHELAEPMTVDNTTYRPGSAVVVPADQPQYRLVTAMMQRQTDFDDKLFYDVSTWTLPYAFNVQWGEPEIAPALGERITEMPLDGGRLIGEKAKFAYLIPWNRYFAPRALYKLQDADIQVRLITAPMSAKVDGQTRKFPRGTLMIHLNQKDLGGVDAEAIHDKIQQVVEEDHIEAFAIESGLIPDGPDLGSRRSIKVLQKPRIALLTGSSTSAYNTGEAWHLLSERFGIPVSLLDADRVRSADLSRYDTIILAGGSYSGVSADSIRTWVRGGGRLVASVSGADWAIRNKLVELESKSLDLDKIVGDRPFDELSDARGEHQIGGSIFEITLDTSHPIAFGLGRKLPVFRNHVRFYEPSDSRGVNVATYGSKPLLSGYISEQRLKQAAGSAAVVAARQGSGRVVLIMDNPNFRAFWYGSNGLFLNAIFLADAF